MFSELNSYDSLDTMPTFDFSSNYGKGLYYFWVRQQIIKKEKTIFDAIQIKKLIDNASVQMRAMIWLGLNCGFGCTDCAELRWEDLDLKNGRVKLSRKKTGINRDLLLWPETV